MPCESSRPDKHSPRYILFDRARYHEHHFCQQVGQYDVWLTPQEVWMVLPPKRGEEVGQVSAYSYKHAMMRFPAIEHKIPAMRAMLFGGKYAQTND